MPNPIKCNSGIYRNQPGRIENYVPGRSSVADKERKEVSMIYVTLKMFYVVVVFCFCQNLYGRVGTL